MSAPPGRGNLLAGIQGFKKNNLSSAETVDKSAPPVGPAKGPGAPTTGARGPTPPIQGGAGPFGVPAGGLAAIRAQKEAEAAAKAGGAGGPPRAGPPGGPPSMGGPPRMGPGVGVAQTPSSGPPRLGTPAPSAGPPRMGPPSAGPPPMGGPPRTGPPAMGVAPPTPSAGPPRMGGPPPVMGGPPKPVPASGPASDDRPPNPMGRGNLLAGIQGFKKTDLDKTTTIDKSAPPSTAAKSSSGPGPAAAAAKPTAPQGSGPFGVPAGGLAAIRAQKEAEAAAKASPVPSAGPPRMGPPPGAGGPPRPGPPGAGVQSSMSGPPPRMGPPSMGPSSIGAPSAGPPRIGGPAPTAVSPKPVPASGPASDDRPPNPMGRGNLLAGIQGFKKTDLDKTTTIDKSAPPSTGPAAAAAKPTAPQGSGPFGVPAGGLAAIRAQKEAEAAAKASPVPSAGPPRMGPPPGAGGPPSLSTGTGGPPRAGPPSMGAPPTPTTSGPPPRMGPPLSAGASSTPSAAGPPPGFRMPPPGGSHPPKINIPQTPSNGSGSSNIPSSFRQPPSQAPEAATPRSFGAPPPGFSRPTGASPTTPASSSAGPVPVPGGFNPSSFRPAGTAPSAPQAPTVPATPSGSRPCITSPMKKEMAWYSRFALGEHLIDHIIAQGLRTPDLFRDKGFKPQVDTLYSFVTPTNTFGGETAFGVHLHTILPQLTPQYLGDFSPNSIAEVLRLWVKDVKPFSSVLVQRAVQIAASPDPNQRLQDIKTLLEQTDKSTQTFIAHILEMCNLLWTNESATKLSKAILAYSWGPLLFPIEMVSMEDQTKIKNLNRLVEDMIMHATRVSENGFAIMQANSYQ